MASFHLPLSGAVNQVISPITNWFSPFDNRYSLITVNLGRSSAPAVEADVIAEVGSYGRQLGKIAEAVEVLARHLPASADLSKKEQEVLADLTRMLKEIETIKRQHGR